jgi:decaprenylphospho-beta-D-ribofuranose 2-oxidase
MLSWRSDQRELICFDGSHRCKAEVFEPDRYRFFDSWRPKKSCIPIGAGLSLAPAFHPAAHGEAISSKHFNRILAFDPEENEVTVETGITLGELFCFSYTKGLFLPVQPGHPAITIGGCVAANVHGKNPSRDGTILRHVRSLRLFHPSHGVLYLDRENRPDLFRLTCGGLGLTGFIQDVTLKLRKLPSGTVKMRTRPVADIMETPQILAETAKHADLVFTWHNLTATGGSFGQGFICDGSFGDQPLDDKPIPSWVAKAKLSYSRGVPFWGRFSTPLFNWLFGSLNTLGADRDEKPLVDLLFPVHNKTKYYRLFGKKGMIEYQILMATNVWRTFVSEVRNRLQRHPVPITLGSAKLFDGDPSFLQFDGRGICVALDFPRDPTGLEFAAFLDQLVLGFGLRPNICKDSRLPRQVAEKVFDEYHSCRTVLREFDPGRIWASQLSERLGL